MKRIILTAAALTLAGPALAASQLEKALGVSPDVYTPAQLAELHFTRSDHGGVPKRYHTEGALVISTTGPAPKSATPVPSGAAQIGH